jgi:hypothetical protein
VSFARQSGFEIVGTFLYPFQAELARTLLECEGIQAWIFDEHEIRMQWHLAGALGGVKVVVTPDHAPRAREILAEDRSAALTGIPELALPAGDREACPRCRSVATSHTRMPATSSALELLQALLFFFTLGLLVPRRTIRVRCSCNGCGHAWTVHEHR